MLEWLRGGSGDARGQVHWRSFYGCSETLALLAGTGIQCPPAEIYLKVLLESVREHHPRGAPKREPNDPLDSRGE
ncbi:MAG: hypothetical protein FJ086_07465 [Deltaproteobacteria bacterium]|nr:hypothetical protein [Deltaproteobacteria bacterium]